MNFEQKLKKIENLFQTWKNRTLTLLGKVTIINTLAMSQFLFSLAALPSPSENFYINFKRIVLKFLWDEKPHKISYNKIIQDYDKGGLKLMDLQTKELALKARWPLILGDREAPWLYGWFPLKDHRIWQANMEEKHVKLLMRDTTARTFESIWCAWSRVNFVYPEPNQYFSQLLWGNSQITRAGKPFMDPRLMNSFLTRVGDLFNERGCFYSFERAPEQIISGLDILFFNSIKSAIPKAWVQTIRETQEEREENITQFETFEKLKFPTKFFYWWQIEKKHTSLNVTKLQWETEFKIEIEEAKWTSAFRNIFAVTNATKLREFHYKIIHKLLTTNIRRAKYTNVSPLCTFCGKKPETIAHLLKDYEYSTKQWKALSRWLKYFFKIDFELTPEVFVLNNFKGPNAALINTLILTLKRYLYVAKCFEKNPIFAEYLGYINKIYRVEKLSASQSHRMTKHNKKWKLYLTTI